MRRFNQIIHSSRAAIDLASIMVGVIIIGLIGGVISATVFAVIPWSQDKAAKQQLESIHTAENAFFGLSGDANVSLKNTDGTTGSFRNTFTGSAILDSNNLLSLNKEGLFCVVSIADGKDYHAYSKSGSGKWFSSMNSKKTPVEYTGSTPCVNSVDTPVGPSAQTPGTVDAGVDDGTKNIPTSPVAGGTTPGGGTSITPAPTTEVIKVWDFESGSSSGWTNYSSATNQAFSTTTAHESSRSLNIYNVDVNNNVAAIERGNSYTVGTKYRLSAWVYPDNQYSTEFRLAGNAGTSGQKFTVTPGQWNYVSFDFVGGNNYNYLTLWGNQKVNQGYYSVRYLVDDVKLERVL